MFITVLQILLCTYVIYGAISDSNRNKYEKACVRHRLGSVFYLQHILSIIIILHSLLRIKIISKLTVYNLNNTKYTRKSNLSITIYCRENICFFPPQSKMYTYVRILHCMLNVSSIKSIKIQIFYSAIFTNKWMILKTFVQLCI